MDSSSNTAAFLGTLFPMIVFRSEGRQDLYVRLRANSPLDSDMNVYAGRQQIARSLLRFTFKGSVVSGTDTPESLGVSSGDHIDVIVMPDSAVAMAEDLLAGMQLSNS